MLAFYHFSCALFSQLVRLARLIMNAPFGVLSGGPVTTPIDAVISLFWTFYSRNVS